jgi:hypothetical protein
MWLRYWKEAIRVLKNVRNGHLEQNGKKLEFCIRFNYYPICRIMLNNILNNIKKKSLKERFLLFKFCFLFIPRSRFVHYLYE